MMFVEVGHQQVQRVRAQPRKANIITRCRAGDWLKDFFSGRVQRIFFMMHESNFPTASCIL